MKETSPALRKTNTEASSELFTSLFSKKLSTRPGLIGQDAVVSVTLKAHNFEDETALSKIQTASPSPVLTLLRSDLVKTHLVGTSGRLLVHLVQNAENTLKTQFNGSTDIA